MNTLIYSNCEYSSEYYTVLSEYNTEVNIVVNTLVNTVVNTLSEYNSDCSEYSMYST